MDTLSKNCLLPLLLATEKECKFYTVRATASVGGCPTRAFSLYKCKTYVNDTYTTCISSLLQDVPYQNQFEISFNLSFIHFHSTVTCRMQRLLAVLRSFFHSSLLYTLSFHPFPPTILPSSLTSSYHLFLGLLLSLCFQIHI